MEETRLREDAPRSAWQTVPVMTVDPDMRVGDALELLAQSSGASVPVVAPDTGRILGVFSRPGTDAIEQTSVPRLGGMATPLGVYLTDGVSGGGVGFWGLCLTGLLLGAWSLLAQGAARELLALTPRAAMVRAGFAAASPAGTMWLGQMLSWVALPLLSALLVFVALRLSPLSGTHAAEHQVVHCLERRQPLLPECVRTMPRVHPRCGTNIVTGFALFQFVFLGVFAWAQAQNYGTFDAVTLGLFAAAPLSLLLWRRVGGWLQFWLATRPPTPAQIDSAIFAARQVLARREQRRGAARFALGRRIWAMGLPAVMVGYCAVLSVAEALGRVWPQAGIFLGL